MRTIIFLGLGLSGGLFAQPQNKDVPLMNAAERAVVDKQSSDFTKATAVVLKNAARSTVRIWGISSRDSKPVKLAYGTVIDDGSKVISKWSELNSYLGSLVVQNGEQEGFIATVAGVFTDDDLVVLDLKYSEKSEKFGQKVSLPAAQLVDKPLPIGKFLLAAQPSGQLDAFGVVGVLERNLRETDRAHLGIIVDRRFRGVGVRIDGVQPGFGAAEAGIEEGDIILSINERKIGSLSELQNSLVGENPGDEISVKIKRGEVESEFNVMLSNRPLLGQFRGGRLLGMERMGGKPNEVSSGFADVVQSDMTLVYNHMGGPIVDLDGDIVGIAIARASRTRTFIFSSRAIKKVLAGEMDSVADARAKLEVKRRELLKQQQAMQPRMRPQLKPRSFGQMQRNNSDLGRLLGLLRSELDKLDQDTR